MIRQLIEEKGSMIVLNVVSLILNIVGVIKFYGFYKLNSQLYGNKDMYIVSNAIRIAGEEKFKELFFLGILIVIILSVSVISNVFFLMSSFNEIIWKIISLIGLIVNFVIACFSIKYYVIGVLVIGVIALAYSALHASE